MSEPRRAAHAGALTILAQYRGLVFVDKPVGLQTEPDARTSDTLVSRLASQLGVPAASVHALSRLDTGVSGVVTLGLSSSARRMVQAFREQGRFERRYLALAAGQPSESSGTWLARIGRAAGRLRSVEGRHAEAARTDFAIAASCALSERATPRHVHVLALAPRTGRTHQLRVHCSAHGLPLLGDRAYGGVTRSTSERGAVRALDRIALHAAWVELPVLPPLRVAAPDPAWLLDTWQSFGGDQADLWHARQLRLGA